MLTLSNLMSKGYFPQEIIPPINTVDLSTKLSSCLAQINNIKSPKTSKCTSYSVPRLKNFRRILGIPNPLHQFILAKTIIEKWSDITSFFLKSDLSTSIPIIAENTERAIVPLKGFSEIIFERALKSNSARYLLRADISRFYHSIYTHSIPWAIHSKNIAKLNRDKKLFGNAIDKAVMNTRDGQTMGIPIGPDTSRIISEIIGVAIDIELQRTVPNLIGIRHVDDYWLYFKSLAELEKGYSAIQKVLQEYELELNHQKTQTIELPEEFEAKWVTELKSFRFRNQVASQKNDLISFFSIAFHNAKLFPNDYVIQYAITKASQCIIAPDNWNIFEALILRSLITEPKILPISLKIFLTYKNQNYPLNASNILTTISQMLDYHVKLGHSYEISWILWFCKTLNLQLNEHLVELISHVNDSIAALVALDIESSGLTTTKFKKNVWQQYANANGLYSEHWILAYEANMKGWFSSTKGHDYVENDSFFNILKQNDVSFYETTNQLHLVEIFTSNADISLPFNLITLYDDQETNQTIDKNTDLDTHIDSLPF
ncbi:MAG: RNA-directed DNA polymerase [Deferribacteres bacterium]|nr:RNA-directed DNA polymerase [Deferribacteres bacterium]